jgi:hypothetical protein
MVLGATALLSGFVLFSVPTLWVEYRALRNDWEISRRGTPLAFIDISPNPSYAEPPTNWVHTDGDTLLLWSGWHGQGHGWFRVPVGQIDPAQLHKPLGRDVIRAIDQPIVEVGAGQHWDRLLTDTPIISLGLAGVETAYPLLLLQKVEVVNDTIKDRFVTVVSTPFVPEEASVHIFDPMLHGQRLTFGLSGHFLGVQRSPLLYDRQTESLWQVVGGELACVAGKHQGVRLKGLAHPAPTPWARWMRDHEGDGRLIVGAERGLGRSKLPPAL